MRTSTAAVEREKNGMSRVSVRVRTTVFVAGTVAALALGGLALLHTPLGRPLLARMAGGSGAAAGGCPIGVANATPEKLEAQRAESVKPLRGDAPAPAKRALGFTLGTTSKDDVSAFARAHGITCKDALLGTAMRCTGVDARALGEGGVPIADLFFRFDPAGKLVALDAMHDAASGDDAARLLDDVARRLAADLGAPSTADADRTAARLTASPVAQASLEYRFLDYAVDVSATNFEGRGVIVREQYRAL